MFQCDLEHFTPVWPLPFLFHLSAPCVEQHEASCCSEWPDMNSARVLTWADHQGLLGYAQPA